MLKRKSETMLLKTFEHISGRDFSKHTDRKFGDGGQYGYIKF